MISSVFMDAVHFNVREDNRTVKKVVYVAIGVKLNRHRAVPGMWIGGNESAKYWRGILNEIKNRGVEDNLIMSIDAQGRRSVRFRPVSAEDTEDAMEQLIFAYMDARDNPNINQLLLIPCVILDFLCIHPFADGNGRVSRLFSLLLMYKNGYDVGKYISFEEQINLTKEQYYDALHESAQKWQENQNSYVPFMENFLMTLYLCYKELDKRFFVVNGKKLKKNERVEQTVMNSVLPVSKAEICEALSDVSVTTVEVALNKLVKSGKIKKLGQSKNTKYVNTKYIK